MTTSNTTKHARPAGVILAGGLSRRMFAASPAAGEQSTRDHSTRDKALLSLGADTMLDRVIARLRPQVAALALNANGDPARFAEYGLPVIADTVPGFVGPLAGVLAGMRWAVRTNSGATHIVTVSSDAPFLPNNLVERLVGAAENNVGAIALAESCGELHPVIGCWPVTLADDLENALNGGVRKVLAWTDVHGTILVPFPFVPIGNERVDPFFNANTPAELDEARRLLGLEAS